MDNRTKLNWTEQELRWIVNKAFRHRHDPAKRLGSQTLKDAIFLLRQMRKYKLKN
jgi:hypothetical protein